MTKFRNEKSHLGKSEQARRNQRLNLAPGGPEARKRRKELKSNCWWWTLPLGNMREIYKLYKNNRSVEDTPKKELKDEDFLDIWWQELTILDREDIISACKETWRDEDEAKHKGLMYEVLEEEIENEERINKEG